MLALLSAICTLLLAPAASAVGLGENIIYHEGSVLDADFSQATKSDSVFKDVPGDSSDERFVELIARLHVDVVAPSKDLAKMMNVVSTKSRATFLQDYERYFEAMDLGSVSRPMLLAYLGLEFTDQEQLMSWYAAQRGRISDKVARSCKSLLDLRAQLHRANAEADSQLAGMFVGDQMHKLHRAYLLFQNNLNLFMLENYLLLCSRLEPERLSVELEQSGFLFHKEAS